MRRSDIKRARRFAVEFARDATLDEVSEAERLALRIESAQQIMSNGGYEYRLGSAMLDIIRRNARALSASC